MKSLRFLAVVLVFFITAMSWSANPTITDKSTTVDNTFISVSLEVADFSTVLVDVINFKSTENKQVKKSVASYQYFLDPYVPYGGILIEIKEQSFTKIKRFPNARDALTYFV